MHLPLCTTAVKENNAQISHGAGSRSHSSPRKVCSSQGRRRQPSSLELVFSLWRGQISVLAYSSAGQDYLYLLDLIFYFNRGGGGGGVLVFFLLATFISLFHRGKTGPWAQIPLWPSLTWGTKSCHGCKRTNRVSLWAGRNETTQTPCATSSTVPGPEPPQPRRGGAELAPASIPAHAGGFHGVWPIAGKRKVIQSARPHLQCSIYILSQQEAWAFIYFLISVPCPWSL